MEWLAASEIVTGLILTKRVSLSSFSHDMFFGSYSDLIKDIKKSELSKEELCLRHGIDIIQSAEYAAKSINGLGNMDWYSMLNESASLYSAGVKLEKLARKMQKGEHVDQSQFTYISKLSQQNTHGFTPLSDVESKELPFIKSGWKVWDDHVGGICETGLIVVGGNPGVGKTSWVTGLIGKFATRYPEKIVAMFSLEMILGEIATRFREIDSLPKEVEARILLEENPMAVEAIIEQASMIDNLGLVAIDFADLLIQGETSESSMSHIYRTLMLGAKRLHCPIILLSQLSRYDGTIPKPKHLRWTGLAESLGWMIVMLYNPNTDWHKVDGDMEDALPTIDDHAYNIIWKVRGGFRKHPEDCPGAILIPFRGDKGWHPTKGRWVSLKGVSV